MTIIRELIDKAVEDKVEIYKDIALQIHDNPEVSNYEFFASEILSEQLIKEGFDVKLDVAGHCTGFDARYRSRKPGPIVVFYAEYDALPGTGHACGHNLFGATSSLAAVALKEIIDEVGGEVRSELGLSSIGLGAKVLAHTALDIILDPALLERIKKQHEQNVKNQN